MDLERMPFLSNTKEQIENSKKYIDLLNNRKKLINSNKQEKSEYEKNEDAITILLTDRKLGSLHSELSKKEEFFKNFYDKMAQNIDVCNSNFDMVYAKALAYKANTEVKKRIEQTIEEFKAHDIKSNYEARIQMFILLKDLITKKKL